MSSEESDYKPAHGDPATDRELVEIDAEFQCIVEAIEQAQRAIRHMRKSADTLAATETLAAVKLLVKHRRY
ncbi:hypothetical protein [Paraburkholderia sp. DHOC27]|uniref:hypothetical protein n=1 Tax=Paraburkholderia sp. DHOC27 TaxID=2303330 RepID=UPI000E3C0F49|nr:hypothetical protein [Paraburkholderia sp. DHOC27]RFU44446.1 hypothetical protein D0B32_27955 [Paraburkholderia sp. DHOC27]